MSGKKTEVVEESNNALSNSTGFSFGIPFWSFWFDGARGGFKES